MALKTTVIGSYPKPDNLKLPNWFETTDYWPTDYTNTFDEFQDEELEKEVKAATREVIDEQIKAGIDVITDGEISRECYVFHFCRKVEGFDFANLILKTYRNGALKAPLPRIVSKIGPGSDEDWAAREWKQAQELSSVPVKYTIPGPMTIIGSTHNDFYTDVAELSKDLVKQVNKQIRGLAQAGCRHIQLDEPVMVRNPDIAAEYGIDHAAQCFEGVGPEVTKTVHLCCGYPLHLDQTDYLKADRQVYFRLADQLDNAGFDAISIEDAHQHNDLKLLEQFKKSKVVFGVIAIANSRVETVEEIRNRLGEALQHIPADRLIVAPDCGLGFLPGTSFGRRLQIWSALPSLFLEYEHNLLLLLLFFQSR
ncbi:5-methyltetrahydropteroyltriglutamate--homocysteine methyltransferase-like isoform X2 [Ptychodera flava]|uniref:5-methyltetrahydropteroyltriglutamate-- homocysteine methyltransferase-like isoform X2 n=1 Tax=Ptychodera flava TaxID=63121 RepID=UPI003969D754